MKKRKTETDGAPPALGPYSQGIESGGFVFCSGQIGVDPVSSRLVVGVASQTRQTLENLSRILRAAGLGMEDIVRTEVYLARMDDFAAMNEAYGEAFSVEPYPSRVTVGVASLPKGALVEIACVAGRHD